MPLKQLQVTNNNFPPGEPDVQRTTFSVDVMGRFICNTFDEATVNLNFDVVVIGSGMYGAYCAAKIFRESAAPGRIPLRVLVLEAGPFLVHEHGQNIPDLGLSNPFRPVLDPFSPDAQKTRNLVWGMGWRGNTGFPGTAYCVGGKSLYWGGWCPRLRAADLAQWPDDVRNYLTTASTFGTNLPNRLSAPPHASVYEAVEFEIGVKPADDFVFDPILGPEDPPGSIGLNEALRARLLAALTTLRAGPGTPLQDPEPPPIAVQTQSFVSGVFSPDKYSSLTLLISALRSARGEPDDKARLFLVPNCHVARLEVPNVPKDGVSPASYRVTGIDLFVDGARRFLPIKPTCTVVLALGCIESTKLALESFPTAPQRPGNDEIMGRNLMAHLRFDFPFQVNRQQFAQWVQNNTGKQLRDRLQTASFHLQADTPDGRFHFQVYGTGDASGSPEGLLYRMIPDSDLAQRLADMQDPNKINLILRACGEMRGDRLQPVHAAGTSWIDLASNADRDQAFDHARAFVHYHDPSQAAIWNRMRQAAIALATELGAQSIPGHDPHEVGSTWHDSGTLFLGDNPDLSVTDVCGQFHHMSNAACVDQALFPTVGSANPVLTGLCLSRKFSENLVDRYVSEPDLSAQQITTEKNDGFEFLLESPNAAKWKPNHSKFTSNQPALIAGGTIIEVHGNEGLGVLFYDDPNLFGNFELRLQWKAFFDGAGDITTNSGIFLRAPRPGTDLTDANFYDKTVEIQIDETGYDAVQKRFRSPLHRTGAIYKFAPARVRVQKILSTDGTDGIWNEYRIRADGQRITVRLNGKLASEGDVPNNLTGSGLIGLQYHTGKVQFRSVRVRRL